MKRILTGLLLALSPLLSISTENTNQAVPNHEFLYLEKDLPTPNNLRLASGAPGHAYWQQEVNYKIAVTLNEDKQSLEGSASIIYKNNSPDELKYIWLQLEQNRFNQDSIGETSRAFADSAEPLYRGYSLGQALPYDNQPAKVSINMLKRQQFMQDHQLGYQIKSVEKSSGNSLSYTIVDTLMRIDLPTVLKPRQTFKFSIHWSVNLVDVSVVEARAGYEHFQNDPRPGGNYIFQIAQWFPRLVAYSDYQGWHNKQSTGDTEYALEFGDYDVTITVPGDHIVSATGVLKNPKEVLTDTQRERLRQAKKSSKPLFIVTPAEALENEKMGTPKTATWHFEAKQVRDFAWASSRKFIWDAQRYEQPDAEGAPAIMAMSFYPKEAEPLWSRYSTIAVIHSLGLYSRFAFDYPYPVAQSVNGPVAGMEYPMITFTGARPVLQEDGTRTYSRNTKRLFLVTVIHEIGHIFFPMIVNTDERQWGWLDEGVNTFLHGLAQREWSDERNPTAWWDGDPLAAIPFMQSSNQVPLMTKSDNIPLHLPNVYIKTAAALSILRETILGRELFDFAFKEYSRRWRFKRPTPADFFRTMEDASGVDLSWFWWGWFYTTDHVDISLDRVSQLRIDTRDPDIDFPRQRDMENKKPESITVIRNRTEGLKTRREKDPSLRDFYDEHDPFTPSREDRKTYREFLEKLENEERRAFLRAVKEDKFYYILEFSNQGGLIMPIILDLNYVDGTTESIHLPAEIWRFSPARVNKLLVRDKELKEIIVDPNRETADVNTENNYYPRRIIPGRLNAFEVEEKERDLMWEMNTKENK